MNQNLIIDTHTHLIDDAFKSDFQAVLQRAEDVGIRTIISVSENIDDAVDNLKLSEQYSFIKPAAGLYPAILDMGCTEEMIEFIKKYQDKLVAIGEVGLDFWIAKNNRDRDLQMEILSCFVDLSQELDLPLNIHSRSAGKYVIQLLLKKGAEKVQLHAFDGKASAADPAIEAGFFFSIPPSAVKSKQKQKLIKRLPLSNILLETDSPVLGPEHGKRNEPANIIHSLNIIAEIKNIEAEEVIQATYQNTLRLYGKLLNAD